MSNTSHLMKKFQRTISHDSSLKPKQLHHLQTLNNNLILQQRRDDLRHLLRSKLVKRLSTSESNSTNNAATIMANSSSSCSSKGLMRRTSVCKNVFEFEEDSMTFNENRQYCFRNESDDDNADDDVETRNLNDKENFIDQESIGKRISSMALSIVAKDGRELFGEMPTRKIPIANIVRTNQLQQQQMQQE